MWNENSDEAVRPWAVAKKRSPVCSDMKWIWSEAPDYKSVLHTQDWWNWTNVKGFQSTPTHTNFTLKHETSSINCHTLVLHDDKKKKHFRFLFVIRSNMWSPRSVWLLVMTERWEHFPANSRSYSNYYIMSTHFQEQHSTVLSGKLAVWVQNKTWIKKSWYPEKGEGRWAVCPHSPEAVRDLEVPITAWLQLLGSFCRSHIVREVLWGQSEAWLLIISIWWFYYINYFGAYTSRMSLNWPYGL